METAIVLHTVIYQRNISYELLDSAVDRNIQTFTLQTGLSKKRMMPRGNCNPRLENVRLQTGHLQMGHFETPHFQCSEVQRLD